MDMPTQVAYDGQLFLLDLHENACSARNLLPETQICQSQPFLHEKMVRSQIWEDGTWRSGGTMQSFATSSSTNCNIYCQLEMPGPEGTRNVSARACI